MSVPLRLPIRPIVAALLLALLGCRDSLVAPQRAVAPGAARHDDGGDDGDSAGSGAIDVRTSLDNTGTAVLEVRTGTYDPVSKVASPNGYFTSIQYKIFDTTGRQQLVKDIHFHGGSTVYYSTIVDLCSGDDEAADPGPVADAGGGCPHVGSGWTVAVKANLKGVSGDGNRTDVVRDSAVFLLASPPANGSTTVDVIAAGVQRRGDGVNPLAIIALDTTLAGDSIIVQTIIQDTTATATSVECTISADGVLTPTPVGTVSGVAVPAHGTAVCQYVLYANVLGAYPITVAVTPSAGSPADPHAANNFASVDVSSLDLRQEWFNLLPDSAFPAESLSLQNVRTNQLVLGIIPTQNILGTFTLKGTVSTATVTYPTGVVSGTLHPSAGDTNCELTVGPNAPFASLQAGFPAQLGYFADICATPATVNGESGYQSIAVDYVQSLSSSVVSPGPYLLTGTVRVQLELSYTLQGAVAPDTVRATIDILVPSPVRRSVTSDDGSRVLWSEQNTVPATVFGVRPRSGRPIKAKR